MIIKIEEQKNYTKLETIMVNMPIALTKVVENAKYAYILAIKDIQIKIDTCQYESLRTLILSNNNISLKIINDKLKSIERYVVI